MAVLLKGGGSIRIILLLLPYIPYILPLWGVDDLTRGVGGEVLAIKKKKSFFWELLLIFFLFNFKTTYRYMDNGHITLKFVCMYFN